MAAAARAAGAAARASGAADVPARFAPRWALGLARATPAATTAAVASNARAVRRTIAVSMDVDLGGRNGGGELRVLETH